MSRMLGRWAGWFGPALVRAVLVLVMLGASGRSAEASRHHRHAVSGQEWWLWSNGSEAAWLAAAGWDQGTWSAGHWHKHAQGFNPSGWALQQAARGSNWWPQAEIVRTASDVQHLTEMAAMFRSMGERMGWTTNVRLPRGFHLEAFNGLLPDTPMVQYLRWRWSIDPARFDSFHQQIGPMIEQDLILRERAITPPQITATQVVIPPVRPPRNPPPPRVSPLLTGPHEPPMPPPPPVPEPTTLVLAIAGIAWAGWQRRRLLRADGDAGRTIPRAS